MLICIYWTVFILLSSFVFILWYDKNILNMLLTFFFVSTLACYECVYVYSSFWAPLFDPRILNYQVDIKFDPDDGKKAQEDFKNNYGYRGEQLIADLGNGKWPQKNDNKKYEDVKFHYTYK